MCEETFSASFVPQPAENNTYLHKTLHGTDHIPSCIAVLLSISFIRWSEPSMVKASSFVCTTACKSDISFGLHQSKRMEKTKRTDTIPVL